MSAIQLSAGSESNDKERRPLTASAGCTIARERRRSVMQATAAFSAESAYLRRVLPIGVLRNLGRGLHGDLAALACAGAIVTGLAFTATGFLKIRWTRPAGPPQEVGSTLRDFRARTYAQPVLPLVVDVSSPPEATFLRHAPAATRRVRRILTPPAITGLPPDPRGLAIQQRRGLASGPWCYLRSRHHVQRQAVR